MPRFEQSIDIRAPINVVFEALTDPKRGGEWNPNIIDVSHISNYPVGEGSTWDQVVSVQGLPMTMHCRIESFHPPRSGTLQISGGQNATIWTRCEEAGGLTRVTQTVEFVMPGGKLGALASGLAKTALRSEFSRTLQRQRDVVESQFGDGHGPGPA